MIRRVLLFVSVVIIAGCAPYRKWYGTWDGMAVQDEWDQWSVKLSFDSETIRSDYPSSKCGGEVTPDTLTSTKLTFVEKLDRNENNQCMEGCYISIERITEDSATYTGYYPNGELGAKGYLLKQKPPEPWGDNKW